MQTEALNSKAYDVCMLPKLMFKRRIARPSVVSCGGAARIKNSAIVYKEKNCEDQVTGQMPQLKLTEFFSNSRSFLYLFKNGMMNFNGLAFPPRIVDSKR
jgi:hypothetical protein